MEIKELEIGVEKYGTPLYIYDTEKVEETVKKAREKFSGLGLCFAMKANPFLVKEMAELTDRIEVCSAGEFYICARAKIPPEKLLISGVLKKKEELWKILDHYQGKCSCNVESPDQLFSIIRWGEKNRRPVCVYLRLSSGNQFGMDEKKIRKILGLRKAWPWLKIQGIHFFSGTLKKAEKMKKELEILDDFLISLKEELGFETLELEYGPGLSVPYFQGQKDRCDQDWEELFDGIKSMRWKGKVTLEMGRAFTASCGYYLTRAEDIKKTEGRNLCITDGGIHQIHYDGQIRGMYHPRVQILPVSHTGRVQEWDVYGSLCTVNDVLIQKISLQGLKKGSVLVFENTGAYSAMEGMALFLSHELPKIAVFHKNKGWKLARRELETYRWNMNREDIYGDFNGDFTEY